MTEDEIRLECLRLAHEQGNTPQNVTDRARQYSDYVLRRNDQVLRQKARELAAVA